MTGMARGEAEIGLQAGALSNRRLSQRALRASVQVRLAVVNQGGDAAEIEVIDRVVRSLLLVAALVTFVLWTGLTFSASAKESHATPADRDHDGLSDRYERRHSHTKPRSRDTDRDRLGDGWEVRHRTNPRRRDTDGDGLSDGYEVKRSHTNPRKSEPARLSSKSRDISPPDTTITSGPAGSVASSSASFSFSGSDNVSRASRLRFECRVDGGAWGACTSPTVYSGLADGSHGFDVRARDAAGNIDPTPASRTWTIDTLSAVFTYSPGLPFTGQQTTFDASGSTCTDTPCRYEWVDVGTDGPGGTDWPLGSGQTMGFTFQQAGTKYVQLTVTDAKGASAMVEGDMVVSQSLDTIPPDTAITASPPASTASTSASFSFTSTEAGSTFECRLDSGSWAPCASPQTYSSVSAASHTFSVRATDPAGNVDTAPASYTWTVQATDTSPPDTSISSGPSGTASSSAASFSFSSTEYGSSFECRIDGSAWSACSSPKSYSALADGSHSFDVRAKDAAGNVDATPASRSWTVDTTPPDTTLTAGPSGTATTDSASFSFSSSESGSTFQCQLDSGAWVTCTSPKSYSSLANGSHTFSVRAADSAANTDVTPASRTWTVNTSSSCNSTVSSNTAIVSAAANAANEGKIVCVANGNYGNVTFSGFSHTTKVTLRAQSKGQADFDYVLLHGVTGLRIENFRIHGSIANDGQGASNIDVVGNDIGGGAANGFTLQCGISNWLVENNHVHDLTYNETFGSGYGMYVSGPCNKSGLNIRYNTFERMPGDGMELGQITNFQITGNVVSRSIYPGYGTNIHPDALMIWARSSNGTVTDNRLLDSADTLISPDGADITFANNLIARMQGACMDAHPNGTSGDVVPTRFTWRQNTFWTCGYDGLNSNGTLTSGHGGNVLDRNLIENVSCSSGPQFSTADHNLLGQTSCFGGTNIFNFNPPFQDTVNYLPTLLPVGYSDAGYRSAPAGYTP